MFLLHKCESCLIKQLIFIALKKRSSANLRKERTQLSNWFPGSLLLFLTENAFRVGALEMNLTSISLALSDQLEFAVHLLLSSVLLLRQVSLKPWRRE